MHLRKVPTSLIIASGLAVAAIVAGCGSGGGHGSALAPSATINVPGSAKSGTTVTLHFPATRSLDSLGKRTAQYVSGKTMGVYISGTCFTGGGTVTQSCTGASFPATYADVSSSSPLCTASNGGGQTCSIAVNPAPGFSYQIKIVAVDARPSPEASGYGSSIPTTANVLSVGAVPPAVPSSSPAPSPTPTQLGFNVVPGAGGQILGVILNPVATQFVRVDQFAYSALTAEDNVLTEPAIGPYPSDGLALAFATGDAAGNLISAPACISQYQNLQQQSYPTATSGPPPGTCDNFAGPDGKEYPIFVTSSVPTHLCSSVAVGNATAPPCTAPSTSPSIAFGYDNGGLVEWNGGWQYAPPGMLQAFFTWDAAADNDTCSGTTPKCGVPIPIGLNNEIPATATAGVGKTTSYNFTNTSEFELAPFVTTVSCGTNSGCAATTSCYGTTYGTCPNLSINNGGTATITGYLYASGTVPSLTAGNGCYSSLTVASSLSWCMGVATSQSLSGPATNSSCYTGLDPTFGTPVNLISCSAVLDPGAGTSLPTGTIDCTVPPSYTGTANAPFLQIGQTVAYLEPVSFTKGSVTAPGTADAVTYKVVGVASGVGYCSVQLQDTARLVADNIGNPSYYGGAIGIEVSSSNTIIPIPSPVPFP